MKRIPLAWLQLKRERVRLAAAVLGIGFAVLLVFMQLGFSEALYSSSVRVHGLIEADIFLVSPKSPTLAETTTFSRRRLYQV
ncbi:MAG: ABC transporter, partial [Candidatus Binatia bacterium]